jgi:hypothetical protein
MGSDKMTGANFMMGDLGLKKRPAPSLDVGEGVSAQSARSFSDGRHRVVVSPAGVKTKCLCGALR